MPTSITVAPSRTSPGPTTPALPTAHHEDVRLAGDRGEVPVREWQIVTVACACSRSSETGLPTMSLRPTTTARAPSTGTSYSSSSAMTPSGSRPDVRRPAEDELAEVQGMEPVDVLHGVERANHACLVDVVRQWELDEDSVDRVVRVQLLDLLQELLLGRLRRKADVPRVDAHLRGSRVLEPDVDVRGRIVADENRRQPDLAELTHLLGDLAADPLGGRLAVDQRAATTAGATPRRSRRGRATRPA